MATFSQLRELVSHWWLSLHSSSMDSKTITSECMYLLGTAFESKHPDPDSLKQDDPPTSPFDTFVRRFACIPWFTYRKGFPPIKNSTWTTDVGWGCMLRSGQMLLAQALVRQVLGTECRLDSDESAQRAFAEVISLFADDSCSHAQFSLHNIIEQGLEFGKKAGEWYGPSTIAHVLEKLVSQSHPSGLAAYTSDDGMIYKDRVADLCSSTTVTEGNESLIWRPLLLMLPLRLGLDRLNPLYIPVLLLFFQLPQFLGVLGGRPRSSLYLVGCQGDNVVFLDPHYPQPVVTCSHSPSILYETYRCTQPRRMSAADLDPSLAVCFYCKDKDDFLALCDSIEKMPPTNRLVNIAAATPSYRNPSAETDSADDVLEF
mmetsp:Transcript_2839/g.5093  ORF Transcript_2839/g.5093 Transcript_2839/m.5093 type:complete len:372 (+) Transcript_2839:52-1167(+)|eukprot:CAMPEP_0184332398 /NCGR_PEP_ID=MMETSP1089-20130417/1559_1 /TAXON_ID=38269 ORGANISM="Gloeochaete wittrockiana, Strain SAG46.84" /NCGR_SAMPLE_ID=MMETSP1089 /ASSEMBLY_ACC=CAM_ASM_000445 /LENGTH=371 /DNA_ID=CAMNT_0026655741 /DNA_START=52 /DNA_END=1167 /DNA_ORIENTATION=+